MTKTKGLFLAVTFVTIGFTFFACSSDSGSSSGGGGGISDVSKQVYYHDYCGDGDYRKYTGGGDVYMEICTEDDDCKSLHVGEIENGQLNLNLPSAIGDGYLGDVSSFGGCYYGYSSCIYSGTFPKVKFGGGYFYVEGIDGGLHLGTGRWRADYYYFQQAATIKGTVVVPDSYEEMVIDIDINAKQGWNLVYGTEETTYTGSTYKISQTYSTNKSVISGELNWVLYTDDDCREGK